jgi:phosphate-selective porin OprO/OprP
VAESTDPESPISFSLVSGGPFHSLISRLGLTGPDRLPTWRDPVNPVPGRNSLALILLLVCHVALGGSPQSAADDTNRAELAVGELLSDTPLINSLLIDREIPLIGGRWVWEMFIDAPLNDEPDGAELTLRRAKAGYAHSFGNDWRLKLTGDYTSGGGLAFSDSYVSYSGWDQTLLTLGINDPPFSLESISQSSALTFMERGLAVVALAERKSGGVTILRRNPDNILNATLVLFNVSRDNLREDGQGIVLHYVHSPIVFGHTKSLHLGGSFSYRWNASEDGTQFRTRPEIATVDDYYVDTGPIADADQIGRLSLEASQVMGRFSWQSELLAARVHRNTADTVNFWGAYAFASWFLTGDSRNYNFGSGSYEKVTVRSPVLEGGWGAFELAVRGSLVDLTDRDVIGGREKNLSIGLNWYLNNRIRLMTNLVKVLDVDRPGSMYDGEDPLIFSIRAQWVLD